jgi:phosphatidylglycerol:prolipoprotein diacylglycerol transferase
MQPVLLRWGSYSFYWYTALTCVGILLGVGYAHWQGRRAGYRGTQMLDGALWMLAGGLVGARLAYVVPNWSDYAGRPMALLSFWGGGLVFQGGLVGGILGLLLYALYAELPFVHLADLAAPGVALAQAFGWAGAHVHGANYGLVVRSSISMWLPDLYGIYGPRFPTQFLASLLGVWLSFNLHKLRERGSWPGAVALLYVLCNGIGHFLLEFTRADDAPHLGLFRVTQIAELIEALVAVLLLLYLWAMYRTKTRVARNAEGPVEEIQT